MEDQILGFILQPSDVLFLNTSILWGRYAVSNVARQQKRWNGGCSWLGAWGSW